MRFAVTQYLSRLNSQKTSFACSITTARHAITFNTLIYPFLLSATSISSWDSLAMPFFFSPYLIPARQSPLSSFLCSPRVQLHNCQKTKQPILPDTENHSVPSGTPTDYKGIQFQLLLRPSDMIFFLTPEEFVPALPSPVQ